MNVAKGSLPTNSQTKDQCLLTVSFKVKKSLLFHCSITAELRQLFLACIRLLTREALGRQTSAKLSINALVIQFQGQSVRICFQ